MTTHYLACDLGAESGRLMLGSLAEGRLDVEEIHRFPNTPIKSETSLYWDISKLFEGLKTGLKKAASHNLPVSSISTASWGLDYMLFDEAGSLIEPTFHYRDARTATGVANTKAQVDWKTIFAETGIQFMPINTIYQLAAESPERLNRASLCLMIGDGFNYLLCGSARAEESLASTSQLFNPRTKRWSRTLLDALQLPAKIFPEIVPAGTKLGLLQPDICRETGLPSIPIIAGCSHDTGAAVAAVPAVGEDWAYLSSGTWSLMGVELSEPLMTDDCRQFNFTNEIGYGGSVRLLKNIIGLWLVQQCRREWAKEGREYEYSELTQLAAEAPPFVSLVDPADPRFLAPGNMPGKIAAFCEETGQPKPVTPGASVRCALESLALLYRRTLLQIEQLIGRRIGCLHVIGGGSRNALLNQFTADALQLPVLAGPAEATAAGNILVQAITLGHIPSLGAARESVRNSCDSACFEPKGAHAWEAGVEKFEQVCAGRTVNR